MTRSIKNIIGGTVLGMVGKIFAGLINFISVPVLLTTYGKADFGLISVAMAANSFLQIMNLGIPTGAVKYFSEWIEEKNLLALKNGMQSNLFFFFSIGIVNSLLLIYLGFNVSLYFNVSHPKVLSTLIYILAATSLINWYFISFQHLLMACEKLTWVNFSISIGSSLNVVALLAAYFFKASLEVYFLIYSITSLVVVPINLIVCRNLRILRVAYFIPKLKIKEFKIISGYSINLFAVGVLQYVANQAQPLILGSTSADGDINVSNYKIIQNITLLVSMLTGIFLQNMLPFVAKMRISATVSDKIRFILASTKWLAFFIFFMCMFVAYNSERILNFYVGQDSKGLDIWLTIWIIGLMFQCNQAISALILSEGKFKPLIASLLFAAISVVFITFNFVEYLGVGVSAISYIVYKAIEAVTIFGYYPRKLLGLSPLTLIKKSILAPFIVCFSCVSLGKITIEQFKIQSDFVYLINSGILSLTLSVVLIWLVVLRKEEKEYLQVGLTRLIFSVNKVRPL